jgi:hypothetical protein
MAIQLTVRFRGQPFKVVLNSFLVVCVGDNVEAVASDHPGQLGTASFVCKTKTQA